MAASGIARVARKGRTVDKPRTTAEARAEGRKLWKRLGDDWHSGPLPWTQETAQAVMWVNGHIDALLADADALAGALADRDRLRTALALVLEEMEGCEGRQGMWEDGIDADYRHAIEQGRAALDPDFPAKPACNAPRMAQDGAEGESARNAAETTAEGATARNTEGIEG